MSLLPKRRWHRPGWSYQAAVMVAEEHGTRDVWLQVHGAGVAYSPGVMTAHIRRVGGSTFEESTLLATYVVGGKGRARMVRDGTTDPLTATLVEEFVASSLVDSGQVVVRCEGPPFGNLFGALMFPWLEKHWNAEMRMRGPAPQGLALEAHLAQLPRITSRLVDYFRFQLGPSLATRDHLYSPATACRVARAEVLLQVLSAPQLIACLRYLAEDYWYRRAGWPDLLSFRLTTDGPVGVQLIEVKSHRDQLGKDQRAWIVANEARLGIPFRVIRVRRASEIQRPASLDWPYEPPKAVWAPVGQESHPLVAPLIEADRAETAWLLGEREARKRRHEEFVATGRCTHPGPAVSSRHPLAR